VFAGLVAYHAAHEFDEQSPGSWCVHLCVCFECSDSEYTKNFWAWKTLQTIADVAHVNNSCIPLHWRPQSDFPLYSNHVSGPWVQKRSSRHDWSQLLLITTVLGCCTDIQRHVKSSCKNVASSCSGHRHIARLGPCSSAWHRRVHKPCCPRPAEPLLQSRRCVWYEVFIGMLQSEKENQDGCKNTRNHSVLDLAGLILISCSTYKMKYLQEYFSVLKSS